LVILIGRREASGRSKGEEETLQMMEIALELAASEPNTVGHNVGWNPIPKRNQVPVQQA
jgi:hypothetical protein